MMIVILISLPDMMQFNLGKLRFVIAYKFFECIKTIQIYLTKSSNEYTFTTVFLIT